MTKSQSSTIHLGNIGEHRISSILAPFCIVRHVAQGRDTGIDLYCEILKQESLELTLHFFCQVKTRKRHIKIQDDDLNYWANQPVPVFTFLLKYSNVETINSESEIWGYDVPYLLAINDAKAQGINLNRDVCGRFLICDEDNNRDKMKIETFLYGHVPFSYGLWQMRRYGLASPIPKVNPDSPDIFVGGLTKIYREKIERAISDANNLIRTE